MPVSIDDMIDRFLKRNFSRQETSSHSLRELLSLIQHYMRSQDESKVISAFKLAREVSCRGKNERQTASLENALSVAIILAQMRIDAIGVCAGLVFEAVDAGLLSPERVEQVLGVPTARVVSSMLRLNILERTKQSVTEGAMSSNQSGQYDREDTNGKPPVVEKKPRVREALRRQQAEAVRKMFVAMAEDPRVVMLKLAYRLHTMRNMCSSSYLGDLQEMLTTALETREIYAPLAGRLGMARVESELQDLAFQILEPDKYLWVRDIVEVESKQWRSYVERVCDILRKEMASIGVKASISGRVKHLYSFYRKLERSAGNVADLEQLKAAADVSQIHDLIAFRILVDSTTDCYVALGHVHSLWKPKEGRIKDFIANPKPNGYSALHTTVFCLDDHLAEIQIRTHTMHEMAEYGVAMHWYYKDVGDTASATARELLVWMRQMSEWQREIRSSHTSDTEFMEAVKGDIFQEQIFVFTPKGEVKDLPVGSTPLDFAYRIHTDVGDKCAGARITMDAAGSGDGDRLITRMVPLDYELKSGEIVDIVTSRSAHPTRDWLSFARTAAAKSKIRRYLKVHERDINMQIGGERLERELKALGTRALEDVTEEAERWLCGEFHMDSFEDILTAVGADDLRPRSVAVKLAEFWQLREGGRETKESSKEEDDTLKLPVINTKLSSQARLQVDGVEGLLTRLANCCCPLPSDEIVGFVSRGKGVIVHRQDCRNIQRLRQQDRDRLINVSWMSMSQPRYLAQVTITARDRSGLIRDIATVVSDAGINLASVSSHAFSSREVVLVNVTLEVKDLEHLQRVFARIKKIKDVISVERDLGKKGEDYHSKENS